MLTCDTRQKHTSILGSKKTVDLYRGLKKHGGKIRLSAHVEEILTENGRASGVRLKGGNVIHASKAVVSNASLHDTLRLLPADHPAAKKLHSQAEVGLFKMACSL